MLSVRKCRVHSFIDLCHAVCAEAFNPDDDDEDKEPRVNCLSYHEDPVLVDF